MVTVQRVPDTDENLHQEHGDCPERVAGTDENLHQEHGDCTESTRY